ncbi:uncharacterized protein Z518_11344 [Rhinocladiella mackenziei CBS 650.93]|uniref:Uncharacterized protein n=1 Tax=Rhinocladiella mackenziei CBS 650.93 TaxID=1442369 RepID=A0A0D2FB75_9EURO|nr:uncharacterized protein Z518_11344 [Rhinocladiella mackenziei CBS 650.93]KIW99356.1 hypothetical protein Z518_11344 [Rhinocladiella mackenziei CBS 650.93]
MAQYPFSQPFFFRIEHIRHIDDPNIPPPADGPNFYWSPPQDRQHFRREQTSGWYIWDPRPFQYHPDNFQYVRRATEEEELCREAYRSCTMFWCPDRHGYLIVPIDCTTTHLSSTPHLWRRLSFGYNEGLGRDDLAVIGYHMGDYKLHLPGPDEWFEQLLPDVCMAEQTAQETEGRRCRLAGDLSILIGLIAFSALPDLDARAVDQSFRPDLTSTVFQQNTLLNSPKCKIRGMVVEIGYDRSHLNPALLRRWERGEFGEIFS